MANKLNKHFSTQNTETPQSQPIPLEIQVKNSAGGYVYEVTPEMKLRRFLILGTEGGSYYASEKNATIKAAASTLDFIKANGERVVEIVHEISTAGRAPKNDYALYVLAMVSAHGSLAARQAAFAALPDIARTGTHLFQFLEYRQAFGGWGRGMRKAVQNWYLSRRADQVAFQAVKYRQRNGWSHKDALRLAHPKSDDPAMNEVLKWIAKDGVAELGRCPAIINGFVEAQHAETVDKLVPILLAYKLPREAIPTQFLKDAKIWQTLLLNGMPLEAMIRNLGNMSKAGILGPLSAEAKLICDALTNQEQILKSRLHPIKILSAWRTYGSGTGFRSDSKWTVNQQIMAALEKAFYLSFGNVEKTGARVMWGFDVSGSMASEVQGIPGLSARDASAALGLVMAKTEDQFYGLAFTSGGYTASGHSGRWGGGVQEFSISGQSTLKSVSDKMARMDFGGTDCSLPILYALDKKIPVDVFVISTDNETWAGTIHPSEALKKYRRETGINAKLIVLGMVTNDFSIADPKDPGMLDVVGFDTATPQIMSDFILGRI